MLDKDDAIVKHLLIKHGKESNVFGPEPSLSSPVAIWPETVEGRSRSPRKREKSVSMFLGENGAVCRVRNCSDPPWKVCFQRLSASFCCGVCSALGSSVGFAIPPVVVDSAAPFSLLSAGSRLASCGLLWTRHFVSRGARERAREWASERERGRERKRARERERQGARRIKCVTSPTRGV